MNALHQMKCKLLINKNCHTHFYFDMGIYKVEPFDASDNDELILRALYVATAKENHTPNGNQTNPFFNFLN